MIKKILPLLAVLALGLVGPTTWAQARVDEVGERLVNEFVNDVITLQGRFEQSLIDAEGVVLKVYTRVSPLKHAGEILRDLRRFDEPG